MKCNRYNKGRAMIMMLILFGRYVLLFSSIALLSKSTISYGFNLAPQCFQRTFYLHRWVSSSSSSSNNNLVTSDNNEQSNDGGNNDDPVLMAALQMGLEKMEKIMKPPNNKDDDDNFFTSSTPLVKKLYKNCCTMTKVDTSSIPGAGMGVFATKNIPKGTIVSFYPVHGLGIDYGERWTCIGSYLAQENQDYFRNRKDISSSMYLQYLIGSRPLCGYRHTSNECPLFLDVNPNQPLVAGWTGHYINDGATVKTNTEQGVLDYYDASRLVKNCITIPFGPSPIIATLTTKKIKKDTELFTSYGASFWLSELSSSSASAFKNNDDDDDGDKLEITDAIQAQVQASAKDLLLGMQQAQQTYQKEISSLQSSFDNL